MDWREHVRTRSPEYSAWINMRARCLNTRHVSYKNYGGRGITICERWSQFHAFFEDMGEKPSPEMSLDRIDNDGNYEPSNCRWATPKEQSSNRPSALTNRRAKSARLIRAVSGVL